MGIKHQHATVPYIDFCHELIIYWRLASECHARASSMSVIYAMVRYYRMLPCCIGHCMIDRPLLSSIYSHNAKQSSCNYLSRCSSNSTLCSTVVAVNEALA